MVYVLVCALLLQSAATAPRGGPTSDSSSLGTARVAASAAAATDTEPPRARAIELSDWYYRRLFLHRWGSYIELPLFAAEYDLGNRLLAAPVVARRMSSTSSAYRSLEDEHLAVATGLGVLFTSNSLTGGWNLLEAWPPSGTHRNLLLTHTALMLASDAGFAIAGALGQQANHQAGIRITHRAVAVGSIGLATVGTAMMWIWDR